MGKKYTFEQVKTIFQKEGWTLLSKIYIDNKQLLDVICTQHHHLSINLNNFLTGWRCRECSGRRFLTHKIVKNEFDKIGYTLLSKTYINTKTKLQFKCNKGHTHQISYSDFKSGKRCGKCAKLLINNPYGNRNPIYKYTIPIIKKLFKREKYTLLSKNYKANKKLKIKCPNGHIYFTKLQNFLRGCRCRKCFEAINGKNHHFWKGGKPNCLDCGKKITYGSKRCNDCSSKLDLNPNWQGGIGFYPYSVEFTNKLKEQIRNRDKHVCQKCGLSEKKNKRKLHIHHIDYNKQNCSQNNLISLCTSCHLKTNYNRDYWYAYFMYIIEEKLK